jgi:hypothetical protein
MRERTKESVTIADSFVVLDNRPTSHSNSRQMLAMGDFVVSKVRVLHSSGEGECPNLWNSKTDYCKRKQVQ